MPVSSRNLHGDSTLSTTDIGKGSILLPRKFLRDHLPRTDAEAGHGSEKTFEPLSICIQCGKEIPSRLDLILRHAGAEPFGQRPPKAIESRVGHFQYAAHV